MIAYEQGGTLPAGLSVVTNTTGRPEQVLTREEWEGLGDDRRPRLP